ncbi:hypothetical protein [Methyloversatilis sp. XJ19-49]|uniref:hypothetical protein n=1 Tax=Methyloversatilis sp. XJ19-49 TaxID=2963429 RepID=UPI00211D0745|nr:hypothetical protein [Methyloversatilis sp. XJ19-49]MCQ9378796.1 hypothetical protein [Methyloversatilis sp. XJ19-49]
MRIFDRVGQAIDSAGTDRVMALGAALAGLQTYRAAAGVADIFEMPYLITDALGQWEQGIGDVTTDIGIGDIFDRRLVIRSSNAGSRIDIDAEGTGLLFCVPFAVSSILATAATDVANYSVGPEITTEVYGALAAGAAATAGSVYSTALGCQANASASFSTALGARTVAQVAGAVTSGDGKTGNPRGHALDFTGSNTSAGTTSVAVTNGAGSFAPAASSAYVLEVQVVGRRTAPSAGAYGATIRALVLRSGAGAPTIIGQAKTDISGGLTCDCSLSVVSNTIQVNAQGAASGETWYWAATVRATEQRGA